MDVLGHDHGGMEVKPRTVPLQAALKHQITSFIRERLTIALAERHEDRTVCSGSAEASADIRTSAF